MFSLFRPYHSLRKVSAVLLASVSVAASAAAPVADLPQVPGYYRQHVGELRVTALFDGTVPLARTVLRDIESAALERQLDKRYVPETADGMQTAVNAYLVQRGQQLMLIDAGTAQCFGPGLGQVLSNLKASGYRAEDIDAVLLTHAHPDHMCGILDDKGAIAYPNATVWLAKAEADFWLDPHSAAKAPQALRPMFDLAKKTLAPYEHNGKLRRFSDGEALPLQASVVNTVGHTPGHSSFLLDGGKGEKLMVWGDVLHYHAVQFALPEVSVEFDFNRAQAVESRRTILEASARSGWWVAGAHLPFPGLGHVRKEQQGYSWVPGEYAPLPVSTRK